MSRTDKDVPWWVTAEEWEPAHYKCGTSGSWRYWSRNLGTRQCDLPPEPLLADYHARRRHNGRNCRWEPVWPSTRTRYGRWSPPKWFIDHVDTSPSRVKVRDTCRRAVQEYRATGDVDVLPPTLQHRHCATWLYW